MATDEFLGRLDYYAKAWLPARSLVLEALEKRWEVDQEGGQVVVFEQVSGAWDTLSERMQTISGRWSGRHSLTVLPSTVHALEGTSL